MQDIENRAFGFSAGNRARSEVGESMSNKTDSLLAILCLLVILFTSNLSVGMAADQEESRGATPTWSVTAGAYEGPYQLGNTVTIRGEVTRNGKPIPGAHVWVVVSYKYRESPSHKIHQTSETLRAVTEPNGRYLVQFFIENYYERGAFEFFAKAMSKLGPGTFRIEGVSSKGGFFVKSFGKLSVTARALKPTYKVGERSFITGEVTDEGALVVDAEVRMTVDCPFVRHAKGVRTSTMSRWSNDQVGNYSIAFAVGSPQDPFLEEKDLVCVATVTATMEGYESGESEVRFRVDYGERLSVSVRTNKSTYKWGEAIFITGQVTCKGKPIPRATVFLEDACPGRDGTFSCVSVSVSTDDLGRYHAAQFFDGVYAHGPKVYDCRLEVLAYVEGGAYLNGTSQTKYRVEVTKTHRKEFRRTEPVIVGKWAWFNGAQVTINPAGTMTATMHGRDFNSGHWTLVDPHDRKFKLTWNTGGWVDELWLSWDGKKLAGHNQIQGAVSGERIGMGASGSW